MLNSWQQKYVKLKNITIMKEQEIKILEFLDTTSLSVSQIAKEVSLSKEEVIDILVKNKYYRLADNPNAKLFSVKKLREAAEFYVDNYGQIDYHDVVNKFSIERFVFKHYLEKWYPDYPIFRYLGYNQLVFDNIDTEEKAYWLGFLYADGCIEKRENSYRFEMSVADKDKEHLDKFAKFIDYKREIYTKNALFEGQVKPQKRITLTGKHFYDKLNDLGCTPNKSLTLTFPDISIFKDKSLIRHFIRGYFDGDGCVGIYSRANSNKIYKKPMFNLLGTQEFLDKLNKYIPVPKKVDSCNTPNFPSKAFRMQAVCRDALAFLFYIYHNSTIYLNRKFDKYKDICRLYEELYKELVSKIGEPCDENVELIASIAKGEATV